MTALQILARENANGCAGMVHFVKNQIWYNYNRIGHNIYDYLI